MSGGVYSGEDALVDLMGQASALYGITNPLHPDIFPSVMKFEVRRLGHPGMPVSPRFPLLLTLALYPPRCPLCVPLILQAEICSMVCNMVNGGDTGVVGSITSGGRHLTTATTRLTRRGSGSSKDMWAWLTK